MANISVDLPVSTGRFTTLMSPSGKDNFYHRVFLSVDIPVEARGRVCVSATLHGYVYGEQYAAITVAAKSNTNSFDASTPDFATMDGWTLSANLDSKSISGIGAKTWDVTGDAGKGFVEALASSRTFLNAVLYWADAPGSAASRTNAPLIGKLDDDNNALGTLKMFEYAGRSGGTPANEPYVTLVYQEAETRQPVHSAVAGGAMMF